MENPVIKSCLINLVGEEGFIVIRDMPRGEVTDEAIAEKTGVVLNVVRRTLFILYENRLATYRRERDVNSGWLTYLWKLDIQNMDHVLKAQVEKLKKNLEERLQFEEENVFYACPNAEREHEEGEPDRFLFETASETEFICPVCGGDLEYQDNSEIIKAIKQRIKELESVK